MTPIELETENNFREAVRRLEMARKLPSHEARRAERERLAEWLKLTQAASNN